MRSGYRREGGEKYRLEKGKGWKKCFVCKMNSNFLIKKGNTPPNLPIGQYDRVKSSAHVIFNINQSWTKLINQ